MAGQQPEQVKFGAGQLDQRTAQPGLAAIVVHHQLTKLQATGRCAAITLATAAQQGADTRQQHLRTHRFVDVVVGAQLQTRDMVVVFAARGQHQDRSGESGFTYPAADRQAVFARQHQVQHHQVRLAVQNALHRQSAVRLNRHRQPLHLQKLGNQAGQLLVVLYNQDVTAICLHPCSPTTQRLQTAGDCSTRSTPDYNAGKKH